MNIAAVENKTAIWEFEPVLPWKCIANGGLDVIATLCTLAIKVSMIQSKVISIHQNYHWHTEADSSIQYVYQTL